MEKPYGELELLLLPAELYMDIAMNFLIDLPSSKRRDDTEVYDSILMIMDQYTKMTRYLLLRKAIKAEELANTIMNKYALREAGLP